MKIQGTVISGLGQSSQWMPKYIPWLYPGTLNIKLRQDKPKIQYYEIINTHYGKPVQIARCKINDDPAFIILPPLAPLQEIGGIAHLVEIGANFNLRNHFNLRNGSTVWIEFE